MLRVKSYWIAEHIDAKRYCFKFECRSRGRQTVPTLAAPCMRKEASAFVMNRSIQRKKFLVDVGICLSRTVVCRVPKLAFRRPKGNAAETNEGSYLAGLSIV